MAITLPGANILRFDSKWQARSSTSEKFRRTSPSVLRMAGPSFAQRSVSSQASSNGSVDFMSCAGGVARLDSALLSDESQHPSRILRDRYRLRMRGGVSHPLDSSRYQDRYLCGLSSIFHRRTEVCGYRRARGKICPPLR